MPARRLVIIAVTALIVGVPAVTHGAADASAAPAKDPAAKPLARAAALSQAWGRCPTARPAQTLLDRAQRTRAKKPRVVRARAAVRAWKGVVVDCSKPVRQPTVVLGGGEYLPPG